MSLQGAKIWLHRRRSNFLLFATCIFGLPMWALISAVRGPGWPMWVWLYDAALGIGSGVLWGLLMWVFGVSEKAKQLRRNGEIQD
jgi:hypothetical protein